MKKKNNDIAFKIGRTNSLKTLGDLQKKVDKLPFWKFRSKNLLKTAIKLRREELFNQQKTSLYAVAQGVSKRCPEDNLLSLDSEPLILTISNLIYRGAKTLSIQVNSTDALTLAQRDRLPEQYVKRIDIQAKHENKEKLFEYYGSMSKRLIYDERTAKQTSKDSDEYLKNQILKSMSRVIPEGLIDIVDKDAEIKIVIDIFKLDEIKEGNKYSLQSISSTWKNGNSIIFFGQSSLAYITVKAFGKTQSEKAINLMDYDEWLSAVTNISDSFPGKAKIVTDTDSKKTHLRELAQIDNLHKIRSLLHCEMGLDLNYVRNNHSPNDAIPPESLLENACAMLIKKGQQDLKDMPVDYVSDLISEEVCELGGDAIQTLIAEGYFADIASPLVEQALALAVGSSASFAIEV
ncbi:TPA: hypothetical protein ACGSUT_004401 [Vibrio parahaemolyticus]